MHYIPIPYNKNIRTREHTLYDTETYFTLLSYIHIIKL